MGWLMTLLLAPFSLQEDVRLCAQRNVINVVETTS
jgi:hypothetical protein